MMRILAVVLAWLWPLAIVAEELEEHHPHPGIPWGKVVLSVINFTIFAFVLYRYLWPPISRWVAGRRDAVQTALAKAERARREAEALRAEWQARMDKLAGELEEMLRQAREDIARERDNILSAARQTAETIKRDAERTAEDELRQAREQLRAAVAAQALAIAERMAAQRFTTADQARFVDDFVAEVNR